MVNGPMTLEEAIARADAAAKNTGSGRRAEEYRQLAGWLKELRGLKEGHGQYQSLLMDGGDEYDKAMEEPLSGQADTPAEETDAVGRQAAIDGAYALCADADSDFLHIDSVINMLEDLEPVKAIPPKAHWIVHEDGDFVDGFFVPSYECSRCHWKLKEESDFCPYCGADMKKKGDAGWVTQ